MTNEAIGFFPNAFAIAMNQPMTVHPANRLKTRIEPREGTMGMPCRFRTQATIVGAK
jgi:hypothetical protein